MNRYFLITSIALLLLTHCTTLDKDVQLILGELPLKKLSSYHFFQGPLADLKPNDRVIPYDLQTPLFSDYAQKARFVWMPEGKSAVYTDDGVLDFPEGAVLIKNFFYEHQEGEPEQGKRIIETRLLVKQSEQWEAHSYVWNDNQTEAILDIVGDIVPIDWVDTEGKAQHTNYIIPNKNQCKGCHSYKEAIMPIGPKARNLNRTYAYESGTQNQLIKWSEVGYLTGLPDLVNVYQTAQWDDSHADLHQRAMAYLDMNCGHCHNPHGPGGTTGLNLVYDAPVDLQLGINKPPVAAGRASGGHAYSIVKGAPESSILLHRMNSDEPGVMMPELGRTRIHEEGVELIREWIASLE